MPSNLRKPLLLLAVALCGLAVTRPTAANSILLSTDVNPNPLVTGGPTVFTWDYLLQVTSAAQVKTNNFFVIYDFAGYIDNTATQPTGWTFSKELVTGTVTGAAFSIVNTDDDAALWNLRWTYTGTTPIGTGTAAMPLGHFTANSIYGSAVLGYLFGQDTSYPRGQLAVNSTDVDVPVPSNSNDNTVVPAPAAVWAGLGLLGLLGATRLRRRA